MGKRSFEDVALYVDEREKKKREGKELTKEQYRKVKRKYVESWRNIGYGPI